MGPAVGKPQDQKRLKKETGDTACRWSGRRLIEFAMTGPKPFLINLRRLLMENDPVASKSLEKLRRLDRHSEVTTILNGFETAKNMLEARFTQYTTFLSQAPWNLVALLGYLLPASNQSDAVSKSRDLARRMLFQYDSNQLGNVGDVGMAFFLEHRTALTRWAKGHDHFMQQHLFRQLLGWASALLVMKRLEAKHHLVHVPCLRNPAVYFCLLVSPSFYKT